MCPIRGKCLARPSISEYLRYHDAQLSSMREGLGVYALQEGVDEAVASLRQQLAAQSEKVPTRK